MVIQQTFESTKLIELGSCAFRQWRAKHSMCQYIHGYQLKAKLWFRGTLDDKNWVVDFGGLKEVKEQLRYQFDHTTCVAGDDPELETFKELERKGVIQLRIMPNGVGIERTAEYVHGVVDRFVRQRTAERCWCYKVEVFEHENNSAIYEHIATCSTEHNSITDVVLCKENNFDTTTTVEVPRDTAAPLYCKTDKSLAEILAG